MARTVLVAYHHAAMESLFRKALGQAGLEVAYFTDGVDAWGWLEEGRTPMAVVTTVMLQGLDGFELAEAMRREPRLASVPLLLLGSHNAETAPETFEAHWASIWSRVSGRATCWSIRFIPIGFASGWRRWWIDPGEVVSIDRDGRRQVESLRCCGLGVPGPSS